MDMIKTGKFLCALRKAQGLTQEQLGEKLGVTNKTISRWETGVYLPPVDALLELSRFYSVSINEILTGERLDEATYKRAAEENLRSALTCSTFSYREQMDYFKKKWRREHWGLFVVIICALITLLVVGIMRDNMIFLILANVCAVWNVLACHNSMMAYAEGKVFQVQKPDSD